MPRHGVRSLMIVVAAVGLLLGGWRLMRQRSIFLERAERSGTLEASFLEGNRPKGGRLRRPSPRRTWQGIVGELRHPTPGSGRSTSGPPVTPGVSVDPTRRNRNSESGRV